MSRNNFFGAAAITAILALGFMFHCELPQDPKDPSNTAVKVILVNSDWVQNSQAIIDTVDKVVQIGVQVNLPENIDSIGITISSNGVAISDTIIKRLTAGFSDTIWQKISFPTSGKKTVIVTPHSTYNVASVSAVITIVDRIGPILPNSRPSINVAKNIAILPGQICSLSIATSDGDAGQNVVVSMTGAPDNAALQGDSLFIWTPPADFIGYDTISFTVTDNGKPPLSSSATTIITVTTTPHPPTMTINGRRSIKPQDVCTLTIHATDQDADQVLKISMAGNPDGAEMKNDSLFVWKAPAGAAGEYDVKFTVIDNGIPPLSSSETVRITVSADVVNRAPKWTRDTLAVPLNDTAMYSLQLPTVCSDPDSDPLTYSLSAGAPAGDTVIGNRYSFKATPALIGKYPVQLFAADSQGAKDTMTLALTVESSAADTTPPVITLVAPAKDSGLSAAATYLIDVLCSDASGIASVNATVGGTTVPATSAAGHYTMAVTGLALNVYTAITVTAIDSSVKANKRVKTVYVKYNPAFTVTYSGNGNTSGIVPVDEGTYQSGATVAVKANTGNLAKTGFSFAGWNTAADGSGATYAAAATFVMGAANDTLFALWTPKVAKPTYALTVSATNGSVTKVPDLTVYDSGTVVTLTPVPAANYHFTGWSGAMSGTANPGMITMDGAKTVTAAFAINAPNSFSLSVSASNGTVTKTPDAAQYDSGTAVTLTPVAAPGYRFSGWGGDLSGTTSPGSIMMNAAKNVTANFTIVTYTLTVSATNGTVTKVPSAAQYDSGTVVALTAVPAAGYEFTGWSGGLTGAINPGSVTMDAAKNVTASFSAIPLTLTMSNDGHGTTTPSATATVGYNVATSISATPSTGYSFSNWSVAAGTATIANPNAASTTVTLTTNATIKANFTANPVTLTITNDGHGSTTPTSTASGSYNEPISISAIPATGYSFSGWTVTAGTAVVASPASAATTASLTTNATVRANFTAIPVTLTLTNDGNGSSTPTGSVPGSYNVPFNISASPAAGYSFSNWTVTAGTAVFGNSSASPTTVTLTANATIKANFVMNAPAITPLSNKTCPINGSVTFTAAATGPNLSYTWYMNNSEVGSGISYTTTKLTANEVSSPRTYKCVVTNSAGSANSSATLAVSTVSDKDNNVYHEVKIGAQIWMMENLKVTQFRNGTPITNVTDGSEWAALSSSGYCWYNNDITNKNKFGALYNWHTVSSGNLAPTGWHVPSNAEWDQLDAFCIANGYNWDNSIGGADKIGKSLAATEVWRSAGTSQGNTGNDLPSNNRTGFTAFPNGCRSYSNGAFYGMNETAYWWSSTEWDSQNAINTYLEYYLEYFSNGTMHEVTYGYGVRCVKD